MECSRVDDLRNKYVLPLTFMARNEVNVVHLRVAMIFELARSQVRNIFLFKCLKRQQQNAFLF